MRGVGASLEYSECDSLLRAPKSPMIQPTTLFGPLALLVPEVKDAVRTWTLDSFFGGSSKSQQEGGSRTVSSTICSAEDLINAL